MCPDVFRRPLHWATFPACPCGCGATGLKLQSKHEQHLVGCVCRSCLGRRNVRMGKRGQAQGHRALGGKGFTPSNEESVGGYPIRVQVEWKAGAQIPVSFRTFVQAAWTRDALRQADRARRIGDHSMAAIGITGAWGKWLVVQLDRDMDGTA